MMHPGLTSWAKFSRPFGTSLETGCSRRGLKAVHNCFAVNAALLMTAKRMSGSVCFEPISKSALYHIRARLQSCRKGASRTRALAPAALFPSQFGFGSVRQLNPARRTLPLQHSLAAEGAIFRAEKMPGAQRLDHCGGDRHAGIDRPAMILTESCLPWSLAIGNPSLLKLREGFELPHRDCNWRRGRTDVRLELRSDG